MFFRGDQTTSSLIITHASRIDSGQYQCDPSASYPQHVNVHVIDTGQVRSGQVWWQTIVSKLQIFIFCLKPPILPSRQLNMTVKKVLIAFLIRGNIIYKLSGLFTRTSTKTPHLKTFIFYRRSN